MTTLKEITDGRDLAHALEGGEGILLSGECNLSDEEIVEQLRSKGFTANQTGLSDFHSKLGQRRAELRDT